MRALTPDRIFWGLLVVVGLLLIGAAVASTAFAQADLPLLRTTAPTFELKAALGNPGQGDEICAIDEAQPSVYLICAAPVADQVELTVPVILGQTTTYRAVTKLGTVVSDPSPNMRPVEGVPLPPTVLE